MPIRRIFYRCVDWNIKVWAIHNGSHYVASFTDAWIETWPFDLLRRIWRSHLLQMRGLKPHKAGSFANTTSRIFYRCVDWNASCEEWYLCGGRRIFYRCVDWNLWGNNILKPSICRIFYRCVDWNLYWSDSISSIIVASFTDAWIETGYRCPELNAAVGRIFYRCVDWNPLYPLPPPPPTVASFTDAWIETRNTETARTGTERRIFYRCVDWNNKNIVCRKPRNVASFTDAWIETVVVNIVNWVNMSHLLQMRGLKHSKYLIMTLSKSRIFYRCVDWNAEYILVTFKAFCRIFYRCVDWNLKDRNLPLPSAVASFTDAWIETLQL